MLIAAHALFYRLTVVTDATVMSPPGAERLKKRAMSTCVGNGVPGSLTATVTTIRAER
jgi:hypothetical protein